MRVTRFNPLWVSGNTLYTYSFISRGKQFCFPSSPNVSLDFVLENIRTLEGPDIKCFAIFLDSLQQRQKK